METPLHFTASCKIHSVICFFLLQKMNWPWKCIHCQLCSLYEDVICVQMVCCWWMVFIKGWENVHDDECNHWPATLRQSDTIGAMRDIIDFDQQVMLDEIMILRPPNLKLADLLFTTYGWRPSTFRSVCKMGAMLSVWCP